MRGCRAAACLCWMPLFLCGAPCKLSPQARSLNLGPTDYSQRVRPRGEIKAVMIFVDFPDAPAGGERPRQYFDAIVPYAAKWMSEVSNGVASLKVTPVERWYRMPKASTRYHWEHLTTRDHRVYVADAIAAAAGARIDWRSYDVVYIAASRDSGIASSPTFEVPPGAGVPAPGGEIRQVVTLGNDARNSPEHYGSHVLLHETGHLFGLPDLYEYEGSDYLRAAGGWDNMSWVETGGHFTAWEKAKLGWIKPDQVRCVEHGAVTADLTPDETADGLKAVAVPVSSSKAYVVEAREEIGADARLCDSGVLVYTVDSSVLSGKAPLQVMGGTRGVANDLTRRCGPAYDATLGLKPGKRAKFEDTRAGFSVEVLKASPDGYTVRVSKLTRLPARRAARRPSGSPYRAR